MTTPLDLDALENRLRMDPRAHVPVRRDVSLALIERLRLAEQMVKDEAEKCLRLQGEKQRLVEAILDIDSHATPLGEDPDGFTADGYFVTLGALHRALGLIGHSGVRRAIEGPQWLISYLAGADATRRATQAIVARGETL